MKKTYLFLIVIAFAGAVVAALLPMNDYSKKELSPDKLQAELNLNSRFYSTDQVADLLINKDPSLVLIDVRKNTDYQLYHIPGAINIPLEKLLDSSSLEILTQDFKKKVFYSNGTSFATAAWIIARRNLFENIYILDGGLNRWYETILYPQKPDEATASITELDLYSFRLAASQFFGNNSSMVQKPIEQTQTVKKSIKVVKKNTASGGC